MALEIWINVGMISTSVVFLDFAMIMTFLKIIIDSVVHTF